MSKITFISYAQNFEDVTLWRALHEVDNGFYVDVGAADPEVDSVTRVFYDRGWSGINVEPFEEHFKNLQEARPRDTNLMVAVGKEAGLRTLHTAAGSGLSTLDAGLAKRNREDAWEVNEVVVPVLTLETIVESFAPSTIHFLKIDVEGAEADVLLGLDLERIRPWIIVVEATEPNSTISTRHKWEHLIVAHRYTFAYFDGLNCFYVADEKSELKERLAVAPSVFDNFVTQKELSLRRKYEQLGAEIEVLEGHKHRLETQVEDLVRAVQSEQEQSAYLRCALQTEQNQLVHLQSILGAEQGRTNQLAQQISDFQAILGTEQARSSQLLQQVAELRTILGAEQARTNQLLQEAQTLRIELDKRTRGLLGRLRETGDRLTGGGLRALGKRLVGKSTRVALKQPAIRRLGSVALKPFPKLSSSLHGLATEGDTTLAGKEVPESKPDAESAPVFQEPSLNSSILPALSRSARSTYLRLSVAIRKNSGGPASQENETDR